MKTLKFTPELVLLVKSREKDTTWRLFDDKNLRALDEISLINSESKKEFGKAIIKSVKETTFKNLTEEDIKGHEKFESEKEMLETYSKYYRTEVTPNTILKIIKFEVKELK